MLLIIFVQNSISLILFMIIVQEAIPQISLLFLIVRVTQVLEHFMLEQLIFGTIQLIVIHALTMIPCLLVNNRDSSVVSKKHF